MAPTQDLNVHFHGRVASGHHKLAITLTALAAVSMVVAGLAGAPAARQEPAANRASQAPEIREADLFEPGLIAESRAMTASRPGLPMSASRLFEARLLAEASRLADQVSRSHMTVDEVLEHRLIMETGTR